MHTKFPFIYLSTREQALWAQTIENSYCVELIVIDVVMLYTYSMHVMLTFSLHHSFPYCKFGVCVCVHLIFVFFCCWSVANSRHLEWSTIYLHKNLLWMCGYNDASNLLHLHNFYLDVKSFTWVVIGTHICTSLSHCQMHKRRGEKRREEKIIFEIIYGIAVILKQQLCWSWCW